MKHRPGGVVGARRHGSAALSLSAFAGAKASTYDKRARLERERALNAKKVNAYRKLQKRMGAPPAPAPYDEVDEEVPAAEAGAAEPPAEPASREKPRPASGKKGKFNALEALAQRRAAERAAAEEAEAAAAEEARRRQTQRDEAAAARRRTAEAMRKRNARGQPVMRYRVDAILAKLQAGTTTATRPQKS